MGIKSFARKVLSIRVGVNGSAATGSSPLPFDHAAPPSAGTSEPYRRSGEPDDVTLPPRRPS